MAPKARVERAMDFRRVGNSHVRPAGIRFLGINLVGTAGFEPACSCVRGRLDKPLLYIPTIGIFSCQRTAYGSPCPFRRHSVNWISFRTPVILGWLEELESSFTGSQPAALPYKLQPHLVDLRGIEPRSLGCRPSMFPLSPETRIWSECGESNSVCRAGNPTLNQ
jgi:hypothetical protein